IMFLNGQHNILNVLSIDKQAFREAPGHLPGKMGMIMLLCHDKTAIGFSDNQGDSLLVYPLLSLILKRLEHDMDGRTGTEQNLIRKERFPGVRQLRVPQIAEVIRTRRKQIVST